MAKSRLKFIRRSMGGETTLEGAIDAMGKEREEQVLERISQFTDEVVVIVKKLQVVVERFVSDQYEELDESARELDALELSLIHISEPTRRTPISYAVFCLK